MWVTLNFRANRAHIWNLFTEKSLGLPGTSEAKVGKATTSLSWSKPQSKALSFSPYSQWVQWCLRCLWHFGMSYVALSRPL